MGWDYEHEAALVNIRLLMQVPQVGAGSHLGQIQASITKSTTDIGWDKTLWPTPQEGLCDGRLEPSGLQRS